MEHHTTTSRAEAERLLGIAEKLLRNKDFSGCRDFAILAQETEPLLEGSEQILAVAEVLLAAENRRLGNSHHDWYSILQIPNRNGEIDLIRKQYRRLALLLHPDKNKFAFADSAFRIVADAWAVLSDPVKKSVYDSETAGRFAKVDLVSVKKPYPKRPQAPSQAQRRPEDPSNSHQKLPVRRSGRSGAAARPNNRNANPVHSTSFNNSSTAGGRNLGNFWTACPYCYNLYEYSRVYEGCCLRCDNMNCRRAFTAAELLSMPPMVPGKEAYFCCWGFFPMGFRADGADGFPKWMPPLFGDAGMEEEDSGAPPPPPPPPRAAAVVSSGKKKRGRPRKNL